MAGWLWSTQRRKIDPMATILIKNAAVVTLNDSQQVIPEGYVLIENDLITEVGSGQPPAELSSADQVIEGTLMAVMPGMVNAHTHLFQTFLRGLADDQPLLE